MAYDHAPAVDISTGLFNPIVQTAQDARRNYRSVVSTAVNASALFSAGTDYVYFVSGTSTLTLLTAVGNTSLYYIKNTGSGTVTVACYSSETIDGSTTITLTPNSSISLLSDNTNWRIV